MGGARAAGSGGRFCRLPAIASLVDLSSPRLRAAGSASNTATAADLADRLPVGSAWHLALSRPRPTTAKAGSTCTSPSSGFVVAGSSRARADHCAARYGVPPKPFFRTVTQSTTSRQHLRNSGVPAENGRVSSGRARFHQDVWPGHLLQLLRAAYLLTR